MPIVGQMLLWPTQVMPKDWLACDGDSYNVSQWEQLWATIAVIYGEEGGRGGGRLPDFVQNRALGSGSGHPLGSTGKDSSIGSHGIGYTDIGSIICAAGSLYNQAPSNFLGTILPYAGRVIPDGYAFCQGQLLSIMEYPELYSVIGPTYGGDGRITFALPDLQGRTPLGADDTHPEGQKGEDLSIAGDLGYQAINYITQLKPPPPGQSGADTPFVGEIVYTATTFAPRGWGFCQGQLLPIDDNPALFSLIGTTFGGDGTTTFALPDLRGSLVVPTGQGTGCHGLLSTAGNDPVAYLSVQTMIALEGIFPASE